MIKVWDVTAKVLSTEERFHDSSVDALIYSPGGDLVAGYRDGTIEVFDQDLTGAQATIRAHRRPITSLAFSPDAKLLFSASSDATVKTWEINTQIRDQNPITKGSNTVALDISPDGKVIAVSDSRDGLAIISPDAEVNDYGYRWLDWHGGWVEDIRFSPDGKMLASGSDNGAVELWDVATGKQIGESLVHGREPVTVVAFSPDGKLAARSADGTVKVWDISSRKVIANIPGVPVEPDIDAKDITLTPAPKDFFSPKDMAFSLDGKSLVLGRAHAVELWDWARAKKLGEFKWGGQVVGPVALSRAGGMIAVGLGDGTVRLLDAALSRELGALEGHENKITALAFSSDGARLVVGDDGATVKLWDTTSRRELLTLEGHMGRINAVDISAGGGMIVTSDSYGNLRVWRAATAEEVAARGRSAK
jgi:WD40 repeat protein